MKRCIVITPATAERNERLPVNSKSLPLLPNKQHFDTERETDRQREKRRHRERYRETHRNTMNREREREKERDRERQKERERERGRNRRSLATERQISKKGPNVSHRCRFQKKP